ncbi:hypothetical protein, partial [uncultured Porphyromonas sp.]|uniref:hypothetical protein n=1 Tax=uncultured Porphyromonas sp. TaxID=159274 RepID=UPI00261562EC
SVFFGTNFRFSTREKENSSDISFDSSEVSFDSSEVSFLTHEDIFDFPREDFRFLTWGVIRKVQGDQK